jgi:hypothetical protein
MYGLTPLGAAADNAPLRKIFRRPIMTMSAQAIAAPDLFSDQPIDTPAHKHLADVLV